MQGRALAAAAEGRRSVIMEGNGRISSSSSSSSIHNNSENEQELRFYESIMFSGPIIFTLIILFLFYFFYLRRHSVDWSSLRMRQSRLNSATAAVAVDLVGGVGVKKEFRELLPIIIYKESFSVKDTLCSVCLGEYQAEDRLQQIPGCGHTFHLCCIDHWLATHTTCPLCRLSLINSSKAPPASHPDNHSETERHENTVNTVQNIDNVLLHSRLQVL